VKISELELCVYFFTLVINFCHNLQDYVTFIHQCWFCVYFESMEKMQGSLSLVERKEEANEMITTFVNFHLCLSQVMQKRDSFISFVFIGC
jgi:hypothetical protein